MNRLLDNRYRILNSLAEGGFGTTFLAEDTRTPSQRRCVVKQLKPVAASSGLQDVIKQRFTREAAVLEELGHDNRQIPLLYAYFEESNEYYLVQEYVQGETLTQHVQRHGRWSEGDVQHLLHQMLPVLAYIHDRGIIHRDIKPDNLILRQKDGVPVLIDFGAVKEAMNSTVSAAGQSPKSMVIGTAGFMAPEQAVGRPMFSSDLYAFGLTVIYCLTGKLPHELDSNPTTGEIYWQRSAPSLSSTLASVLTQAISPNPHGRFSTAQAMLKALEQSSVASPVIGAVPPPVAPMTAAPTTIESMPTQVASPGNEVPPPPPAVPLPVGPAPETAVPAVAPPSKRSSRWPMVAAWLAAVLAISGIAFAVTTQVRLPRWLNIRSPQPEKITQLPPGVAGGTVNQFYQHLSNRSWDAAKSLAAASLAQQFDPTFFEQFQRISVENLQYTAKTNDRVNLVGENTYFYPDGTTQREERTYVVQLIDGQPRIVASKFVRILRSRR
ncbi:protein kinase [filamentous cyanobacterium LEGE 11480]|uniref:non-specific serine/threonine protein kinase n=1 Tax=Romeriopsis navalis LEGE 11480 TaxID=2777977 RepID=A0A928VPV8_9CYAN|nr:serine/threonine protein kinase [Romeriopsis navalis]MBE9032496.1 protein kinase [Romeriopsis navalis LEGE 11480]